MPRLRVDTFLLALAATVAVAAILPARGAGATIGGWAVFGAIGLLFFIYGARLSPQAVAEGLSHWRLQTLVLVATFGIFPLIGLGVTVVLHSWLSPVLALGLMFVCVLPSTVQSSIAFTSIARGNVSAALCSASVSSLVGLVLSPALVALLLSAHGSGFSTRAMEDIAIQLLLPFAAGQLFRPWIAPVIARHRRLTAALDRGSVLLIVYTAFSESVVAGVWSHMDGRSLGLMLLLDTLMLGLILSATMLGSRWLGFSKEDEIAIVFCGSKKSMASGIPLANILFAGQTAGAVVLPLILFHQIQLFVCAALAQRYARRDAEPPSVPAALALGTADPR